jgi:hypothetical protein
MTKSKFGMKENPKTNKVEKEVKEFYLPNQKLEINGEEFFTLLLTTREAFQEFIAPSYNDKREIVSHALLPQGKTIEKVLYFLEHLHKTFIDKGVTCSQKEVQDFYDNLKEDGRPEMKNVPV